MSPRSTRSDLPFIGRYVCVEVRLYVWSDHILLLDAMK